MRFILSLLGLLIIAAPAFAQDNVTGPCEHGPVDQKMEGLLIDQAAMGGDLFNLSAADSALYLEAWADIQEQETGTRPNVPVVAGLMFHRFPLRPPEAGFQVELAGAGHDGCYMGSLIIPQSFHDRVWRRAFGVPS